MDEKMQKMKTPMGHLAESANTGPDAKALVDRQKKSFALKVVKETTLPTNVG